MKGKWIVLSVGIVAVLVVAAVVGVSLLSNGLYSEVTAQASGKASATSPEKAVVAFYDWYLGYIGTGEVASANGRRNPLVDGAHRDCGYLTDEFVAEIDEALASFDKGGFDPILVAQDVPVRIDVGASEVAGDRATVTVEMYWGGNPTPTERSVTLLKVDGAWKIAGVRP